MTDESRYTLTVALAVSLGGFLMGFDASVISGVVDFLGPQFDLSQLELGWAASSLALAATIAMLAAGPLSDRVGRRPVLQIAAILFAVSAVLSALAPNYVTLIVARMLGGLGVGAALVIAPVYIAEIAPPERRGRLVSLNQLNIVIGISVAFFSNYAILLVSQSLGAAAVTPAESQAWRWMLGVEAIPAILYLAALAFVPESPRWLVMRGRESDARGVLARVGAAQRATTEIEAIRTTLRADASAASLRELLQPSMRLVMTIGLTIAVLQQLTGINSVFFYAPMIFAQTGIGTNAAFLQAIMVGLVNLVCTVLAMALIDRIGRRPLLSIGLAGIAASMLTLAYGFNSATYALSASDIAALPAALDRAALSSLAGTVFSSDVAFREAIIAAVGETALRANDSALIAAAANLNPILILVGILGFVASFALSLGPVMWVLFAELFPNRLRGLAVSVVGPVNSIVAFGVTLVFPWQLHRLGSALTFLLYGIVAILGWLVLMRLLPETRGRSLEQLERELASS